MVVEDEIVKTVTERRMEIEQRLTGGEPVVIVEKRQADSLPKVPADGGAATVVATAAMPAAEPIEPTEVSFEHKRLSFERGVSIEQVLQEDVPVREKPAAAAAAAVSEDRRMPSIDEQPAGADTDVDATTLTFHEKRLSFEQGIPVKEIIQKKTEDVVPTAGERGGKQQTSVSATDESPEAVVHGQATTSAEGNNTSRVYYELWTRDPIIYPRDNLITSDRTSKTCVSLWKD